MAQVRIEPLGLHPDLVPVTVARNVAEFAGIDEREFWTRAREAETRFSRIPCAWIAFVGGTPVGSVSLIEHNMDTRLDLRPWLAALYVLPAFRNRGFGWRLVLRCEEEARMAGETRLCLYTFNREAFYERLGSSVISREPSEGQDVVIMERAL